MGCVGSIGGLKWVDMGSDGLMLLDLGRNDVGWLGWIRLVWIGWLG